MEATYANSIVSVEAFDRPPLNGMPAMPRETRGLDNVRKKAQWWNENHTVNSCKVGGPFVAADKFAVTFDLDCTFKPANKGVQMSEVAVTPSKKRQNRPRRIHLQNVTSSPANPQKARESPSLPGLFSLLLC